MLDDSYLRFVLALVFVLALIGLAAWLVRRFGVGGVVVPRGRRRLGLVEVLPLDARRRLVLVRCDDTEHLVLLGTATETVVQAGIRRTPAAAETAEAAGPAGADGEDEA